MVCDEVDDEDCVGVDAGCSGGDGGGEVDCGEEEAGMEGSLSHLYVDVKSCLLYRQVEVTTRIQARQQITLLQVSQSFIIILKYMGIMFPSVKLILRVIFCPFSVLMNPS